MSLDSYKVDKAFTTGVELRLDAAPDDIFLVRLPSMYNRGYSQAVYSGMDLTPDADGNVGTGVNMMIAKYARDDAFVEQCLVSLNGEPIPQGFIDDYPTAVAELLEKADALTAQLEAKVNDAVKKSQPTSAGKKGGQEKISSTEALSRAAG